MNRVTDRIAIQEWLAHLDNAPVECDGFSRAASTLLARDHIEHKLLTGSLVVDGIARIGLHFWIEFPDGSVCDFRARMWLGNGDSVPHGVFVPDYRQQYSATAELMLVSLRPALFQVLIGQPLSAFPRFHAKKGGAA